MGYYVTLIEADFNIPETEEVLKALQDLNTNPKYQSLKKGGSYSSGKGKTSSWFSWMPENYHEDPELQSVYDIFTALGFTCERTGYMGDEEVTLTEYHNKRGQEDLFLTVVAPFVKDESYLMFRGENGEMTKYVVANGGQLYKFRGPATIKVEHTRNMSEELKSIE